MGVFYVSSTAGLLNSLNHSRQVTTRELSRKSPSRQTVGKRASTDDLPQATNVPRVANISNGTQIVTRFAIEPNETENVPRAANIPNETKIVARVAI